MTTTALGMTAALLPLCSVLCLAACGMAQGPADDTASTILAMERAALDRWGRGDPDGFLEISDPDVTYFDPFTERRINGLDELRRYYDRIRGAVRIDHYEIVDPKVESSGDMAVLTFNLVSEGSEGEMRWNTTEVYRRRDGRWRIVHTHWAFTQPQLAP